MLLHTLERTLALVHPVMPFVTEEIWSFHPYREGHLVAHRFPAAEATRRDQSLETAFGEAIALTRQLRGWRDMAGVPPKIVLDATGDGSDLPEFVFRLGRVSLRGDAADGVGPVATVAGFGILPSEGLDTGALTARLAARRGKLEGELGKIEGKLSNSSFVEKAPPEVVAEERAKLEQIRAELAEVG